MSQSYPLTGIAEPGANDVLCGRGGASNNHIGNRRFRMLVNEHRMRYKNSCKLDKPKVAREIMIIWRNQTPPGRFLCKVAGTKLWNDVGDQKAREKASQCLRERDPGDVVNLPPADKGMWNAGFSDNLLSEKEEQSSHKVGGESLPGNENMCAESHQEHLKANLQRDFRDQQDQLLKLHHLQRKVEKTLLQQQNFTKLWSELTQDAMQRQDQEQLHRVQGDLRRRREKLEQQQLALMRAIELTVSDADFIDFIILTSLYDILITVKVPWFECSLLVFFSQCHLQRSHMTRSSSSAKGNIDDIISSWTAITTQPSINESCDLTPKEEIISRKISTAESSDSSRDNADALSLLWSVDSKMISNQR
jgi:hypothetical protein